MPAVVLLSGGVDSAVNLKRAYDDVGVARALTFSYGQRAAKQEIAAAAAMCRALSLSHQVISLPWLAEISTTALTNPAAEVPEVRPDQLDAAPVVSGETARAVWVPNRNGIFINIAAAVAESLGADVVVTGFNAEEAATFPDNSTAFTTTVTAALAFSTANHVRVMSYTQELSKSEIIRVGRAIGASLPLVWSCYRGERELCGRCESCARLERALRTAGAWEWFWEQRTSRR